MIRAKHQAARGFSSATLFLGGAAPPRERRRPRRGGAFGKNETAYLPKFLKRWLNFSTRPAESMMRCLPV